MPRSGWGVDLRRPESLSSPGAGDTVSDTVSCVFTPMARFRLDSLRACGKLPESAVCLSRERGLCLWPRSCCTK
jgi:hypothetical protein